jgi:hypothetical protein
MKKILAFVLVLAFVLSLGSMVLATGDQKDSWRVEGWNAFYSRGQDAVDWVRPIYYDAATGNGTLYVLTQLGDITGTSPAGAVYVANDNDGVGNNYEQIGIGSFTAETDDEISRKVSLEKQLLKKHAITVIVNDGSYPAN